MLSKAEKKQTLSDLYEAFLAVPEPKDAEYKVTNDLTDWDLKQTFVDDAWIMSDPDNRAIFDIILDDEWCQSTCLMPQPGIDRNLFDAAYNKQVMSRLAGIYPQAHGDDNMVGNYARFNRDGVIHLNDEDGNMTTEVRTVKFGQFDRMIGEECSQVGHEILIGQLIGPRHDSKPSYLRPEEIAQFAKCTINQAFHIARIYQKLDFTFVMARKCNMRLAKRAKRNPWDERLAGGATLRDLMRAVQDLEEKGPEAKVQRDLTVIFNLLSYAGQMAITLFVTHQLELRGETNFLEPEPREPKADTSIQAAYDSDRASRQRRAGCVYTDFPKWSPYIDDAGTPYNSDPEIETCEAPEIELVDEEGVIVGSDSVEDSGFTERSCFTYWRLSNIPINKALQAYNAGVYRKIIAAMEKAVMSNDLDKILGLKKYLKKKGTFAQRADFQNRLIKIQERRAL